MIGVTLLILYYFGNFKSNGILAAAGIVEIVGFITHIIVHKRIK
jgi:hypothetical protein